MKETDLFAPVRDYFAEKGFDVAAEVKHCDVVATREGELVVIELKTSLNMTLITQAVKRQRLTNQVYVAIPEPKKKSKRFREQISVLKRLGLGLLTVYQSPVRSVANLQLEPNYSGRITRRKREALEKELRGRSLQPNLGGTRGQVYTAYRETAVTIAYLLSERGPSKPSALAPLTGEKTRTIMYLNHYGWFQRIERGIYDLTDTGKEALSDYPEVVELARKLSSDSVPD